MIERYKVSISHEEAIKLLKKGDTVLRVIHDSLNLLGFGGKVYIEYKMIGGYTYSKRIGSELPFTKSHIKVSDMLNSNWVKRVEIDSVRGVRSNVLYGSIDS